MNAEFLTLNNDSNRKRRDDNFITINESCINKSSEKLDWNHMKYTHTNLRSNSTENLRDMAASRSNHLNQEMECSRRRFSFSESMGSASAVLNKIVIQFHLKISSVMGRNENTETPISIHDMVETITKSDYLWNKFRVSLVANNIVTDLAIKEYLVKFLKDNMECIEEQYNILKQEKEEPTEDRPISKSSGSISRYIGRLVSNNRLSFEQIGTKNMEFSQQIESEEYYSSTLPQKEITRAVTCPSLDCVNPKETFTHTDQAANLGLFATSNESVMIQSKHEKHLNTPKKYTIDMFLQENPGRLERDLNQTKSSCDIYEVTECTRPNNKKPFLSMKYENFTKDQFKSCVTANKRENMYECSYPNLTVSRAKFV